MKTPIDVLLTVVGYWLVVFAALIVPRFSRNYHVNLIWLTVVIPNLLRLIVGNIPRLAVDRNFFLMSTIFSLIFVYIGNKIWRQTAESVKNYQETNRRKAFELSALLMTSFALGALITYYAGIDKSIYSNMGWETSA